MCAAAITAKPIPNEASDAMAPTKRATHTAQSQLDDNYEHATAYALPWLNVSMRAILSKLTGGFGS